MPFVNLLTLTRQKPGFYVKLVFLLQYINEETRFLVSGSLEFV